ncbi:MAG TPA: lysophospholipid acyltransferase family protein [Micromonosporaceae bacterium]
MDDSPPRWRPPLLWRAVQALARILIPLVCRLRITGDVPDEYRNGPLILAGNHIGTFDPICFTAASRMRGISPRMMATGGVFRAPLVGTLMRWAGHISVDRGRETIANAVPDALAALRAGSVIFIYPEGRIGLDPQMWPERGKTGVARLAIAAQAPVVPVATWGSHEVVAYHGRAAMVRALLRSFWRRPTVRIHFGPPVDLSDLREGAVGHAQRGTDRIMDAIAASLASLRQDEPGVPRYLDPTRPVSVARVHRRRPTDARR